MSQERSSPILPEEKVPLLQDTSPFPLKVIKDKNTAWLQEKTAALITIKSMVYSQLLQCRSSSLRSNQWHILYFRTCPEAIFFIALVCAVTSTAVAWNNTFNNFLLCCKLTFLLLLFIFFRSSGSHSVNTFFHDFYLHSLQSHAPFQYYIALVFTCSPSFIHSFTISFTPSLQNVYLNNLYQ